MASMPQRRIELIDFVIDTNRINALGRQPFMLQLEAWHREGVVGLVISDTALGEIGKGRGGSLRQRKARDYIRTGTRMRTEDEFARKRAIEAILFPAGAQSESQKNDVLIVFNADKYGDILLTADGDILRNRDRLSAELGIKWIMTDAEAVAFVRKQIRHRDDLARLVAQLNGGELPTWVGGD